MSPVELEQYLHDHIPISKAMQVAVLSVEEESVVLSAPLEPNINHRETVFGGSASALAILAAWSLLHTRLGSAGLSCRLVIQRNTMEYELPILGLFYAQSSLGTPEAWQRFLHILMRKGKARITVTSILEQEGQVVSHFSGVFVALDPHRAA
jgi:thioesterase domain-containing protein